MKAVETKRGNVWWDAGQGKWVCTSATRAENWNLDLLGNWSEYAVTGDESISEDRSHNVLNQITAINQTGLSYDLQGNLTDDGNQKYVWDIAGRLKEVRDSQDTLIASFKYDPFGRRTTKYILDTNNTYTYYYDGWRVLEEHNNGAFASRNVWGLYLDELVVRTNPMGTDLYPVSNPIYSPLRYYGGDGALEMRIQYTPYGRASLIKANGIPVVPDEASYPILFTGQRYDCETNLYYYKNRYYPSSLGRFTVRDLWDTSAIGIPLVRTTQAQEVSKGAVDKSGNSYVYCLDMPTMYTDPEGEITIDPTCVYQGNFPPETKVPYRLVSVVVTKVIPVGGPPGGALALAEEIKCIWKRLNWCYYCCKTEPQLRAIATWGYNVTTINVKYESPRIEVARITVGASVPGPGRTMHHVLDLPLTPWAIVEEEYIEASKDACIRSQGKIAGKDRAECPQ